VELEKLLDQIVTRLETAVPNDEPFGNAHGNWTFPGLTRAELIEEADSIANQIETRGGDDIGEHEARLQDYVRRLQFIDGQTIPNLWGNPGVGVPAYLFTMNGLRKALAPVLNQNQHADALVKLKKLTGQLRSMEARLNGLDPRTTSLATMVERIERAYNAAEQLPTDLESLSEARQRINDLAQGAAEDHVRIADIHGKSEISRAELERLLLDAGGVLERCETAYSAATSVGLAERLVRDRPPSPSPCGSG
jgi:hypothetical protein